MRTGDSQQHRPWARLGPVSATVTPRLDHANLRLRDGALRSASVTRLCVRALGPPPGCPRPQLLGGSLSWAESFCLEPPGRAPSGHAQLGARGVLPGSCLVLSLWSPGAPHFPHEVAGIVLVSGPSFSSRSAARNLSAASVHLPPLRSLPPLLPITPLRVSPSSYFLVSAGWSARSLLTAFLSLGDSKTPEPGPQECAVLQSALQGSQAPDPASPSGLEQRFYGDVRSPWTPSSWGWAGQSRVEQQLL